MKKLLFISILMLTGYFIYGHMKTNNNQEIIALQKHIYKALQDKDEKLLQQTLHPDFTFISANGDLQNKTAFIRDFAMNPAVKIPLLDISDATVVNIKPTAVLTAVMHIHIILDANKGNTLRDLWERFTATYIQEKGEWQLLALHATYIRK